MISKNFRYFNE